MSANDSSCLLCGAAASLSFDDGKDYFVRDGDSPNFSVFFCRSCEVGFTAPRMTDEELAAYYPSEYESFVPKRSFMARLQAWKYRNDLARIRSYARRTITSLFEVGAGRGAFLSVAKDAGMRVAGIEPGETGVRYAKEHYGILLREGYGSDLAFDSPYDAVVIRHVLEHINECAECVKRIFSEGLSAGGVLFIKVPRLDSGEARLFGKYWHGYDLPRHRLHFTKAGMRRFLAGIGFEDIRIEDEPVPSDIMRSVGYYARFGTVPMLRLASKVFLMLPQLLQLCVAQSIALLLGPFGAGRMIIMARKPDTA